MGKDDSKSGLDPALEACRACEGSGVAANRRFWCWECYGTGKLQEKKYYWSARSHPSSEAVPDQGARPANEPPVCGDCQGTGLSGSRKRHCSACLGSGTQQKRTSGWQ